MPSISGNAAIEVLIGLFFLYFLLSIVCSSINEGIAAVLGLRAKFLEKGLRSMLENDDDLKRFASQWRIQALVKQTMSATSKPTLPSYLSSRTFALTLLDTFAPPGDGVQSDDLIGRAEKALAAVDKSNPAKPVRIVDGMLQDALDETRFDIDRFRMSLEKSFDEVMDRVSGWYKRRVQIILFVLAVGLACAINADSFQVAQRLWQDPALRSAVVAEANNVVQKGKAACAQVTPQNNRADAAATCVAEVKSFGLPLGWNRTTSPHTAWEYIGKIIGLLVTAFALSLGAPFWFDLLGKVANLRGAGPPAPGPQQKTATT